MIVLLAMMSATKAIFLKCIQNKNFIQEKKDKFDTESFEKLVKYTQPKNRWSIKELIMFEGLRREVHVLKLKTSSSIDEVKTLLSSVLEQPKEADLRTHRFCVEGDDYALYFYAP